MLTIESRRRGPDTLLQFDRIIKALRPSTLPKLLNGTPYFEKGHFKENLTWEPKTTILNQTF